jgi:DMSO/TMAO reductase YedYZ molybdopterin-dependent catalytic subunit
MKDERGVPIGRRIVLGVIGLGVLGVVAGRWITQKAEDVAIVTPFGTFFAPSGGFRIYTVTGELPKEEPGDYRLTVDGLVDTHLSLTLDDLAGLPQTDLTKDFVCVTGWRVDDVAWSGVLLRDVLARAGIDGRADAVRLTSFDGVYSESLTLDQAMRSDVLVATSMQGGDLEVKHGAPARLLCGAMYGYKSLKWLSGIELTTSVQPGYWERLGYDIDGWIS